MERKRKVLSESLRDVRGERLTLKQRMSVEFIQKVHYCIGVKRRRANDHMLLALSTVRGVASTQLLTFHPRECQLLKLFVKANRNNEKEKLNFKTLCSPENDMASPTLTFQHKHVRRKGAYGNDVRNFSETTDSIV